MVLSNAKINAAPHLGMGLVGLEADGEK
jgi:hypothetical protein